MGHGPSGPDLGPGPELDNVILNDILNAEINETWLEIIQ